MDEDDILMGEDEDIEEDAEETEDTGDDDEDDVFDVPFDVDELEDMEEESVTYRMDFARKRIGGKIDDVEAVAQAAWKALQTKRFAHLIYDDQYGNDLFLKIRDSNLTQDYLESEVPRMIEEALLADGRILEVTNYEYEIIDGESVHITIQIRTIYGQIDLQGVIDDVG